MKSTKDNLIEKWYLTDGGLETSLIYQQGIVLNHFAAFELMNTKDGREALELYYKPYLDLAAKHQIGFILETPTWRANPDWAHKLGHGKDELASINKNAVKLVQTFAEKYGNNIPVILISGNIGPRGDGYLADHMMSIGEAENYHSDQIESFASANVDLVSAITINYTDEAVGIVNAARKFEIPVVISFTVEIDGQLPSGESLGEAIEKTDALTNGYVRHYMINCAHPDHFNEALKTNEHWKYRIKGIRANASKKSHEELDNSEVLDAGNKYELADNYRSLRGLLPNLNIFGGCCGTDHGHIEEIYKYCFNL